MTRAREMSKAFRIIVRRGVMFGGYVVRVA